MRRDEASLTAERVAEHRAAHQFLDVPPVFDDPLAAHVLSPDAAARLRTRPREFDRSPLSRYRRAFLAARSRFAEDQLAAAVERGVSQYVIVAAGFDTFAYRNPFPALRVFEVDHPATQAVKRRRIDSAGMAMPPTLTFVEADLAASTLSAALATSGFDRAAPAVFTWLGGVPYVEHAAVEETVRCMAASPPGTTVVFDYAIPRSARGFFERLVFDRMARRVAAAGEPWKTFFMPVDVSNLLHNTGFGEVEDAGAAELNAQYFAQRADGLHVWGSDRIVSTVRHASHA